MLNRILIVQAIIKRINAVRYLEIGVSKGEAFLSIGAKQKFGVDPVNLLRIHERKLSKDNLILEAKKVHRTFLSLIGKEDVRFFEMTSDDFFDREKKLLSERKIDVAFIDGLHSYDQALRDVRNCLPYLAPNGIIILHDCNPITKAMGTPADSFAEAESKNAPDWDKLWCGDVWKVITNLRSLKKDLYTFVLDCDFGIGVVTRGPVENALTYTKEQIDMLNNQDLERDRVRLLNLKPVSYFYPFLNSLSKIPQ